MPRRGVVLVTSGDHPLYGSRSNLRPSRPGAAKPPRAQPRLAPWPVVGSVGRGFSRHPAHPALGGLGPLRRTAVLGVFEFVIALVLISTIGKVVGRRRSHREPRAPPRAGGHGEFEGLREAIDDMSSRLERLEKERDFYRDLLESPAKPREIRLPDLAQGAEDP